MTGTKCKKNHIGKPIQFGDWHTYLKILSQPASEGVEEMNEERYRKLKSDKEKYEEHLFNNRKHNKKWRDNNPGYQKEWRKDNLEKVRAYQRKYNKQIASRE